MLWRDAHRLACSRACTCRASSSAAHCASAASATRRPSSASCRCCERAGWAAQAPADARLPAACRHRLTAVCCAAVALHGAAAGTAAPVLVPTCMKCLQVFGMRCADTCVGAFKGNLAHKFDALCARRCDMEHVTCG